MTHVDFRALAVSVAVVLLSGIAVRAQAPPPESGPRARPRVAPAEIQRLFDAYVVMQAQQELRLTDEQYPRFVQAMKELLDVRRRAQAERLRLLAEIRRLSRDRQGTDDAALASRVQELEALKVRTQTDVQRALDAVDQVLDVRQRARFRVFEEQMERRKMELLLRARRNRR
jgi:hypothetical protein